MKKAISILILAIMATAASAQGIGKYKIGSSISEFPELDKAKKIQKSEQYAMAETWKEKNPIEMKADTSSPAALMSTVGIGKNGTIRKGQRFFYLSEYRINTKIEAKSVWLFFRNDTLVFAWTKTILAFPLTLKYGNPETKISSGSYISCEWNIGRVKATSNTYDIDEKYPKTNDSDETFTMIWDTAIWNIMHREYIEETGTTYLRLIEAQRRKEKEEALEGF